MNSLTEVVGTFGLITSDCGTTAIWVTPVNVLRTSQGMEARTRCMEVVVEGER
jgi:hypothetical protein